jgi:hypothetical protein
MVFNVIYAFTGFMPVNLFPLICMTVCMALSNEEWLCAACMVVVYLIFLNVCPNHFINSVKRFVMISMYTYCIKGLDLACTV